MPVYPDTPVVSKPAVEENPVLTTPEFAQALVDIKDSRALTDSGNLTEASKRLLAAQDYLTKLVPPGAVTKAKPAAPATQPAKSSTPESPKP